MAYRQNTLTGAPSWRKPPKADLAGGAVQSPPPRPAPALAGDVVAVAAVGPHRVAGALFVAADAGGDVPAAALALVAPLARDPRVALALARAGMALKGHGPTWVALTI